MFASLPESQYCIASRKVRRSCAGPGTNLSSCGTRLSIAICRSPLDWPSPRSPRSLRSSASGDQGLGSFVEDGLKRPMRVIADNSGAHNNARHHVALLATRAHRIDDRSDLVFLEELRKDQEVRAGDVLAAGLRSGRVDRPIGRDMYRQMQSREVFGEPCAHVIERPREVRIERHQHEAELIAHGATSRSVPWRHRSRRR